MHRFPRVRLQQRAAQPPCPCGCDHSKGMSLPNPLNQEAVKKYLEVHGSGIQMPMEAMIKRGLSGKGMEVQRKEAALIRDKGGCVGW